MSAGYYSICPRCGAALMMAGGCMSCGYPGGSLRERTAADTSLAEKSRGDAALGYVRYELLAEAWDSISKLGRELFDTRTRVAELEAENAKLRKCVEKAADAFRYYGKNVFGAPFFTDRHGDSERCLGLERVMREALGAARSEVDKP